MRKIIYNIALGTLVTACASPQVLMVHPKTGDIRECSASGMGLIPAVHAQIHVDNCVKKWGAVGYKRADEMKTGEFWPVAKSSETGHEPKPATGTCFAVRPNGVLLTNYHVVENAKSIRVHLADGSITNATVQEISPNTDLAILRINYQTPYFLPLARPRTARVGDSVFTMGYPVTDILGGEPKFTEGSISALSGLGGEATLMQISVPVQPGSSGGPLVNERGEVVAVVTSTAAVKAFVSATGTLPQNVNWAVKAEYALPLFDAPTVKSFASSRKQAIEWTQRAICLVEATPG